MIYVRRGAHTQYDIQYHIVWITKYRKKIITRKIASRLKVLLIQGCSANKITIIKENIQPDHVYLLISAIPSLSIAQIMQYLKGRSSKKVTRRISRIKEAILGTKYVGDGIFCRTVGTITNEIIKNYIDEQNDDVDELFKGNML